MTAAIPLQNILISDAVDQACVNLLQEYGLNVTCKFKLSREQLMQEIQNFDGLIVRSDTKVTADILAAGHRLRVIGRAGTGVDNIDIDAATRKGVIVLNTPGGNSISACELTCSLICSLARHVSQANASLRAGKWDRKLYTGTELYGKTLAILGLGRIGREVANRMRSFGMRTIGFDPIVTHEEAKSFGVEKMELNEIWPLADYITVHVPLIQQTKNMINLNVLNKCKKGVKLINVARGGIIDEADLLKGLESKIVAGAGIDVFTEEPPKSDVLLRLIQHQNVLATPHLGASTNEAQVRVAVEVAEQFIALAQPETSPFQVTGSVNAPLMNALRNGSGPIWAECAQTLGSLVERLARGESLNSLALHVATEGSQTIPLQLVTSAAIIGVLADKTKNGLNLINAPVLAAEAGIKIANSHIFAENSETTLAITLATPNWKKTVVGTVRGTESVLLAIDDAKFIPNGVLINPNLLLLQSSEVTKDITLLSEHTNKEGTFITSLSVATGKTYWIVVSTAKQLTSLPQNINLF